MDLTRFSKVRVIADTLEVDTRDCIEMVILEKLRGCTLGAVREELKKEDEELAVKMENLQFLTKENLEVAPICIEKEDVMNQVTSELQRIDQVFSPAEKVFFLLKKQSL